MGELYSLVLELDWLSDMQSDVKQRWARTKYRRDIKRLVRTEIGSRLPPEPLDKVRLRCTRYSSRQPDFINLAQGFKTIIDALQTEKGRNNTWRGVISNDSMSNLYGFDGENEEYFWIKCPSKQGRMVLELQEIRDEN